MRALERRVLVIAERRTGIDMKHAIVTILVIGSLVSPAFSQDQDGDPHPPVSDDEYPTGALGLQTGAEHYVASLDVEHLGRGFYFDPINAEWNLKQQAVVFSPLSPPPPPPEREEIELRVEIDDETEYDESSSNIEVTAAFGLLKASAQFGAHSQSEARHVSSAFSLVWDRDYGRVYATTPGTWTFTPEAQEVLAMSEPERSVEWKRRFGTFIAVGSRFRSRLDVVVSLSESSSHAAQQQFFGARAEYATASVEGSFGTLAEQLRSTSGITLRLEGHGVDATQITLPSQSSAWDAETFVQEIRTAMSNAGTGVGTGLVLIPFGALNGAPLIDGQPFDSFAVGEAVGVARNSIKKLLLSDPYVASRRYRDFTNSHLASPLTLTQSRRDILDGLDGIWGATQAYLLYPDMQHRDLLSQAIEQTRQATDNLEGVLLDLEFLADRVQESTPIVIIPLNNPNNVPDDGCSYVMWRPYSIEIRNLGLFESSLDYAAMSRALMRMVTVFSSHGGNYNVAYTFPPRDSLSGELMEFSLDSFDLITDEADPACGLVNVRISFQALSHGQAMQQVVQIVDQLGRIQTLLYLM